MIRIEQTRFGDIEVEDSTVMRFPNGLVGFPEQTAFVLVERDAGRMVAYLQSVTTPGLAFPVIDGAAFESYPKPSAATLASGAGLATGDLVVLVIVAVNGSTKTLEANLLAPIIVDMSSRTCAQVVLDARKYSAAFPLAAPIDPIAEAKARIAQIQAAAATRARAAV